eukprot:486808-Alexandrium_andersonii.AAC.1
MRWRGGRGVGGRVVEKPRVEASSFGDSAELVGAVGSLGRARGRCATVSTLARSVSQRRKGS